MVNIMATIENSKAPTTPAVEDRFTIAKRARTAYLAQRDSAPREREPDLGGQKLRLSVTGEIPGHTMYWANDEDGKIEELLFEGFDFVEPGEVRRASDLVADMDLTNRVSRYVGRREDGSPLRAYLLKCPQDIWNARQEAGQRQANDWDEQIRSGKMKADAREGQYQPKGTESFLKTNSKF